MGVVQQFTSHGGFCPDMVRIGKLDKDKESCNSGDKDSAKHVLLLECPLDEKQHRKVTDRQLSISTRRYDIEFMKDRQTSRKCQRRLSQQEIVRKTGSFLQYNAELEETASL
ncbi:hypothetical protein ILUMI_27451, partial [Ignelater luminosus]